MSYFHWITGSLLGLVWFSRLADAMLGAAKIADVSRPEWDRFCCRGPIFQGGRLAP
jgi:hypothetical protein